jgi:hypothetical protein
MIFSLDKIDFLKSSSVAFDKSEMYQSPASIPCTHPQHRFLEFFKVIWPGGVGWEKEEETYIRSDFE